ncbi:putative nitrogen fixation protein NifT [Aphanothece sacrum]|uniref:Nitrogen fixation protein FixT n=1 Tax=Aphanothece sacrum FPU1 TaxID=1920663 RepID=A0A401ICP3_APHSA|nr:putative nitrogen fixation protein NifT [Aphanothece sacrum]GBF79014.1 nitrogen fixation protein FixT [Aphanothece sacrum FPU1]GBF86107.1 nitrogen fixation protein FixT [Aphanothece sacrum FPU3]
MKVMLRKNGTGELSVYVPKKDLEEVVTDQKVGETGEKILTLANGWQLSFADFTDDSKLPQTFEATKLPD